MRQEFERKRKRRGYTDPTPPPPEEHVAQPVYVPAGGDFIDETDPITLICNTPDAEIYLTEDGSIPDETDLLWDGNPFTFTESTLSRAKAFKSPLTPSVPTSAQFNVTPSPPPDNESWDTRPMRQLPQPSTASLPASGYIVMDKAPLGNDANPGTEAAPIATLAKAQQLLAGQTDKWLLIRGGATYATAKVYFIYGSQITLHGFKMSSYPGEIAVLSLGFEQPYTSPETYWEPVDDGIPDHYRSTVTYPHIAGNRGVAGNFAASLVPIMGYKCARDFPSIEEDTEDAGGIDIYNSCGAPGAGLWCGPGMHDGASFGDDRLHIRLSHTNKKWLETADYMNLDPSFDYNYKGETDPRLVPIHVARLADGARLRINADNVTVKDLVVLGGDTNILIQDRSGVTLDGLWLYAGNLACGQGSRAHGLTIRNCHIHGMKAPWTSRSVTKNLSRDGSPWFYLSGHDITVDRNFFYDTHDGVRFDGEVTRSDNLLNLTVSRNLFINADDDNFIMDFSPEDSGKKKFFLNWVGGGVQHHAWQGGGKLPTDPAADEGVYMYRNFYEIRRGSYGGNPFTDAENDAGTPNGPYAEGLNSPLMASHSDFPFRPPLYFYHNFISAGGSAIARYLSGLGIEYWNVASRIFNNIMVQNIGVASQTLAVIPTSTLTAGISSTDTAISVAGTSPKFWTRFPYFCIIGGVEIVKVTSRTSGVNPTIFTVVRGQKGTSAQAHSLGAAFAHLANDYQAGYNCQWSLAGTIPVSPRYPTDLHVDPKLVDYGTNWKDGPDINLRSDSPCRNAGTVLDPVLYPDVAAIKAQDTGVPDVGPLPFGLVHPTTGQPLTLEEIFGPGSVF